MRVSIVFDEEDYITPAHEGLDDLLKMLAEVMTQEKVSGSFFVIGERARCLRDRGRKDVLEAVARHAVGSHVNMGSIHPTLTERMEGSDWADGCARMAADELAGIEEMATIIGKPITCLARHGGSFSPQLLAVLGRRNLPYIYSPARLPGHHITWYCNTLNFYEATSAFEAAYLSREDFLKAEKKFFDYVEQHKAYEWCAIFHSHPCKLKTKWFWDKNYYAGQNPLLEDCQAPDFRENFSMEEVRSNWAFHCARLRQNADIRLGTIDEFASEFGAQKESVAPVEIKALAKRAAEADVPFWTDHFSAAEILDFLARSYLLRSQGLPLEVLPRRTVFGPSQVPLSMPSARKVNPEAMQRASRSIHAAITVTGMLPSRITCGEGTLGSAGEMGLGSMLVALGQALSQDNLSRAVATRPIAPYPREGDDIVDELRAFKAWACHRQDLDMSNIARLAALQSWTLKPALPI